MHIVSYKKDRKKYINERGVNILLQNYYYQILEFNYGALTV